MKTIGTIRRENLERVITKMGKLEAVAEAAASTSVYLSQVRNQRTDKKTGRPREMGSAMARRIEVGAGLADGWMDVDHSDDGREPGPPPKVVPKAARQISYVTIDEALRTLGAALARLPASARSEAQNLCATLARAPDSATVRGDLSALLGSAPVAPTWRDCAAELVTAAIEGGKQLPAPEEIIRLVDALYAARSAEFDAVNAQKFVTES